jgi:hypothetical protein
MVNKVVFSKRNYKLLPLLTKTPFLLLLLLLALILRVFVHVSYITGSKLNVYKIRYDRNMHNASRLFCPVSYSGRLNKTREERVRTTVYHMKFQTHPFQFIKLTCGQIVNNISTKQKVMRCVGGYTPLIRWVLVRMIGFITVLFLFT